MTKLKKTLQSNLFYWLLSIIVIIYCLIYIFLLPHSSIYTTTEDIIKGRIVDFSYKDQKLSMTLKNKENLIATFYLDDNQYENIKEKISYGNIIYLKGKFSTAEQSTIPNNFDYQQYLYTHHIHYIYQIEEIISVQKTKNILYIIENKLANRMNNMDENGYMKAFILGDKDLLDKTMYKKYQDCGIAHLFALSGMHIGLLSAIILFFLKKIGKSKYLILNIILFLYMILVGSPASLQRCITFLSINTLCKFLDIQISSIKILLLTITILLFKNPFLIYDTGFLYNIGTVSGILYCEQFIKHKTKIVSSLKLSFVCFLYSLPISLYSFYSINFMSIFYNLIYIPLISIVIYPLCLLTFLFPFLNPLFLFFISILEKSIIFFANFSFSIIHSRFNFIEVIIFYLCLFICFKNNRKRYFILLIIFISLHIIMLYLDSNSYIYYFDVNQGDSSLIISAHHKQTILIDTGGQLYSKSSYHISDNIITFLKSSSIQKIDYLILTHGDYDHMGEAINLINNFKVKNVIFNNDSYNELEVKLIRELENKKIKYYKGLKELNIDNDKLYFLNTKEYDNENDNSNVIYFNLNNYKFLFMGDAGIEREKDILERYNLTDIDFIKIGHHGSNTSSSKEFIESIKPKNCLISVGKNNRYNHPKESVLDILDDYCDIYRTDLNGSIEIKINKNSYKIKTYSP